MYGDTSQVRHTGSQNRGMPAAEPSCTVHSVATTALMIDAERVRRNIERLATYAASQGIAVWPPTAAMDMSPNIPMR